MGRKSVCLLEERYGKDSFLIERQVPQVATSLRVTGQGLPALMMAWCPQKDVCKHGLLWKPALCRNGQVTIRVIGMHPNIVG